jgi:hypothetical protein
MATSKIRRKHSTIKHKKTCKMFPSQAVELVGNTPEPVGLVPNVTARTRRRAPPRPSCKVKVDAVIIQEGEAKLEEKILNLGLVMPAVPYDPFAKLLDCPQGG